VVRFLRGGGLLPYVKMYRVSSCLPASQRTTFAFISTRQVASHI